MDLDITEINPKDNNGSCFKVSMLSSHGCEALFDCRGITVIGVEPFMPEV